LKKLGGNHPPRIFSPEFAQGSALEKPSKGEAEQYNSDGSDKEIWSGANFLGSLFVGPPCGASSGTSVAKMFVSHDQILHSSSTIIIIHQKIWEN